MVEFVKRMIAEHKELIARINKLEDFLYTEKSDCLSRVDFANASIQLKAMRTYADALTARLTNQGIVYDGGEYFEHIKDVTPVKQENHTEESND